MVSASMAYEQRPESRVLLQALEATNSSIVITDARTVDNRIVYVNAAFTKMTGYSREESVGRNCRFLQGTDTSQESLQEINVACKKMESLSIVLRNYRKNGQLFYNELSITPLFDELGILSHYVGVQKDVTSEVMLKQQREDYVATLLHDVKNPLIGAATVLEHCISSKEPVDSLRTHLQLIAESNRSMLSLIHNALDCYREEDGALTVVPVNFALKQSLENCIVQLQSAISRKKIQIILDPRSVTLNADEQLCSRVFTNLIENAIKNSPDGGVIDVSVYDKYDCVEVHISNAGVKIPAALQMKLFTKFSSGNRTTGSGLGLFLSRTILQNHGGSLRVVSNDRLTTFIATFPKPAMLTTVA